VNILIDEVSLPETNPPKNPIKGTRKGKINPKLVEVNSDKITTMLRESLLGDELFNIHATAKNTAAEIIGLVPLFQKREPVRLSVCLSEGKIKKERTTATTTQV
jgi:hypothetical protein